MQPPTTTPPAAAKSAGEMITAYFRDFGVLKETRKEYWGIQIINFLDCTFYFAMLTIATVFLSEDLGLNDKQAGYTTAIFTSATSSRWLSSTARRISSTALGKSKGLGKYSNAPF